MGIIVCTLNTKQDEVLLFCLLLLPVALLPLLPRLMPRSLLEPMDMALLEVPMELVLEASLPPDMPLLPQLLPLMLMLPQLPPMLMPPQLPPMLMLPQLPLPPPPLSNMLATMSTIRSTMFPRSLS